MTAWTDGMKVVGRLIYYLQIVTYFYPFNQLEKL